MSLIRQQLQEKVAQAIIEGRKILTRAQIERLDQLPMGDPGVGVGLGLGITGNALSPGVAEY